MSSDHGPTGTPGGLYVKVKRRDIKKGLRQFKYLNDLNKVSPHLHMNEQIVTYIHEFCIL